jgi:hypothetical protein
LTVSFFDFDNCAATIEAVYTKNRKTVTLPIKPGTATKIRAYVAGRLLIAGVFNVPEKTAEMLRVNLAAELALGPNLSYSPAGRVSSWLAYSSHN